MGFPNPLSIVKDAITSAKDIVDTLHTSEEEKLQAKNKLVEVYASLLPAIMSYEAQRISEAAQNVRAEASGHSWLQRNWRPGMMVMFGFIVFNNYILYPYLHLFFPEAPMLVIPADLWELLKIGIGGYTIGRSAEKIVPSVLDAFKKKENT